MELTGRIVDISKNFMTSKTRVSFELNESQAAAAMYDEYHDQDKITVMVKKYRNKRSLDANAYCWVLLDKLSAKLQKPKIELYRDFIKDVGENNVVICAKNKAVDALISGWEHNGMGWVTDILPSKISGCTNVILYYGSSTYDTVQMSRLTNLIVDACTEQNIPTETPNEIAKRLSLWEGK
jgi:hypothetical protein